MTWTTLVGVSPLVVRNGRLLMIRQRRPYGVHWEAPSGYCESSETLEEAAAREAREETGIQIVAEALPQPDGTQRYEFRTR